MRRHDFVKVSTSSTHPMVEKKSENYETSVQWLLLKSNLSSNMCVIPWNAVVRFALFLFSSNYAGLRIESRQFALRWYDCSSASPQQQAFVPRLNTA